MGFFKQVKDLKQMTAAAPGMLEQLGQTSEHAREYAAAQRALVGRQAPSAEGPIGGVSLELYAAISRQLAAHAYDESRAIELAAANGVSPASWQTAMTGWNARIAGDPVLAQHFTQLCAGC